MTVKGAVGLHGFLASASVEPPSPPSPPSPLELESFVGLVSDAPSGVPSMTVAGGSSPTQAAITEAARTARAGITVSERTRAVIRAAYTTRWRAALTRAP